MKELSPLSLWLGNAADGRDCRRILDAGIKAVVQVAAEEPPLQLTRDSIYCRFPIVDGGGNERPVLALALESIVHLVHARVPTLLCCSAGVSRSPALAAAALAKVHREAPEKWLSHVAQISPHDVSPALWEQIRNLLLE